MMLGRDYNSNLTRTGTWHQQGENDMTHPFEKLPAVHRRRLYWGFFVLTFACIWAGGELAKGFASKVGPDGDSYNIVPFELAHSPEQAAKIMAVWGEDGIRAAVFQTYADYIFLVMYSSVIALGILAVVSGLPDNSLWVKIGRFLAWGQWGAGLCDAIENAAMLVSLNGTPSAPYTQIAYYFATVKFTLLGVGLAFLLIGLPLQFRDREGR
jgi:hypothetical protein